MNMHLHKRGVISGLAVIACIALLFARPDPASAQSTNIRLKPVVTQPAPIPQLPQPVAVLAMLRSTLLAVDHGNKTGNYTVVRDLGSPNFRDANSAAKLAQIFSALSVQGVDLLPVSVVDPTYSKPPEITPARMLYVTGVFPIQPRKVSFEILYEITGGQWRVFGIAISPAP
jgi:ABC-type sugar transport system substrate-binding protein